MEDTEPPYPLVRKWGKDDVLAWEKVASRDIECEALGGPGGCKAFDRGGRVRIARAIEVTQTTFPSLRGVGKRRPRSTAAVGEPSAHSF